MVTETISDDDDAEEDVIYLSQNKVMQSCLIKTYCYVTDKLEFRNQGHPGHYVMRNLALY